MANQRVTCRIRTCNTSYVVKGYCDKHYRRLLKHGSPYIVLKTQGSHGLRYTEEYGIWLGMKTRCNNTNNKDYKNYMGRGIKLCKRWEKFENFYQDMGIRPKGLQLDRIDNNGNYEPANCRWTSIQTQANNRNNNIHITIDNQTKTIAQWARERNIIYNKVWNRINESNWSPAKALELEK